MGKIHASQVTGWNCLLLAGWIGGAVCGQTANVESTTEAFVGKAIVIKGATGEQSQLNHFALSTLTPAAYVGEVTALGQGSLTDAGASWQPNQFNGANGSYYIHFESGFMADILTTDAATRTLTYPGTLPEEVTVGSRYRIRKHLTLSGLFGADNSAGLLEGANSAEADNVLLHLAESQHLLVFFYSSVPGFTGWYSDDYLPAGDTVIYPEQGLMVRRRPSSSVTFYTCGPAQSGVTQVPVYTGYNLIGTLKTRTALPLSQLNLFTGNWKTGLAAGNNLSEADNLLLLKADSTTSTYFYSDYPGWEGWFDASFSPAANVKIPPGTAFFVQRKAPRGLFHWSIPEE